MKTGLAIYVYATWERHARKGAFNSADGDFLIVPQHGLLEIQLKLARYCYVPTRSASFHVVSGRVTLPDRPARRYICELLALRMSEIFKYRKFTLTRI